MAEPLPIVIDTDGGVDDAAALWWALTSPLVEVVAVTTVWGNVGIDLATDNVCRVLHAAGRDDIPVAVGAGGPVGEAPDLRVPDFIHGADGLGDTNRPRAPFGPVGEPAVDLLARLVGERPGELALVTLGPLSTVADLITADPGWPAGVRDLVVMGGAVASHGNALPAGEANVAHDPLGASIVVGAAWPAPPLLVGLDVTHDATLSEAEWAVLDRRANPAAAFLADPMAFYRRFGSSLTPTGESPCHDLLATMAVALPDLIEAPVLPLAVVIDPGPAWGATIADRRMPYFARTGESAEQGRLEGFAPWRVGLGVDVDRFRAEVRTLFGA
ncbi:MAG: nucleoside hydrolase [Acidimicrobiales bacterium]